MPKLVDRVKETFTTTGTGTITVAGAMAGYRTYASALTTGDVTLNVLFDPATNAWEISSGAATTGASWTVARTTVHASSNAGSLVNFAAGTKHIWIDAAATIFDFLDPVTGNIKIGTPAAGGNFSVTATRSTINWHAFEDESILTTSDTGLGYAGFDAQATMTNSSAQDHFVGFQARQIYNGSATLSTRYAGFHFLGTHTGAGTITNAYAFRSEDIGGSGTVTNNYGLYLYGAARGSFNRTAFGLSGYYEWRGFSGFGATFGSANPHTSVQVNGSIATAVIYKTAAYTITEADSTVGGDVSGGAYSITLPTAVGISGRIHTIKKTEAGANALTVATTSSQTIDGASTYVIAGSSRGAVTVQSDGSNWIIIGKY